MGRSKKTRSAREPERASVQAPIASDVPDPEGVAADLLGGREAPGSSTERVRRFRARQRGEEAASEQPAAAPAGVVINAAETGALVSVMWDTAIVPIAGKRRDGKPRLLALTKEQEQRMGEAFAPLVAKYSPFVSAWMVEISALVVTIAVVREAVNTSPIDMPVKPIREPLFTMDKEPEGGTDAAVPVAAAS